MNGNARKKLLEAVSSFDLGEVGDEALIAMLVDKIKSLETENEKLRSENCQEREMLRSDRENLKIEYHRIQSDPTLGARGEVFFIDGDGRKYRIEFQGGKVRGFYRECKGVLEQVMNVSRISWENAL